MSQYNDYASQLDEAFRAAKEATDQALAEFKEAEKAKKDDDELSTQERFQGYQKARIAEHEAQYQLAKENLNKVLREAWMEFYRTRDSLTTALQKAVGEAEAVNADDVDINGMLLLHSDILNSYDLQALQEKYKDNITMTRLVGNKAKELADNTTDQNERVALHMISKNCQDIAKSPNILQRWDMLCRASDIYSSANSQKDAEYVSQISNHWNDDNIRNSIKDF